MSDSGDITNQINIAIGAHSLWKTRLRKTIDSGESTYEPEQVRSSHNCDFGKWLDENVSVLSRFVEFGKAKDLHAKFHEETASILTLALGGKTEDARKAMELDSKFSEVSSNLTRTMMAWKESAAK